MSIWMMIYYVLAPPIVTGVLVFVKAVQLNDGITLANCALLFAGVAIVNANFLWMIHYAGGSTSGQQSRFSSSIETALAGIGAGIGTAFIVWISAPLGSYVMKDWLPLAMLLSVANLIGAYTIPGLNTNSDTARMLSSGEPDREQITRSRSDKPSQTGADERNTSTVTRHFNNNDWFSPVGETRSSDVEITSVIDAADFELAANRIHQASSLYDEAIEASRHMERAPAFIWRAEFGMVICLARLNQHAEAVTRAEDLLRNPTPLTDDAFLTLLEYSGALVSRQCWAEAAHLLTVISDVSGSRIDQARKLVMMVRLSLAYSHTNQVTHAIALLNEVNSLKSEAVHLNRRESTSDELAELARHLTALGESSARGNSHALSSVLYATAIKILNLLSASG